jgi:hypothetical protein
MFKTERKDQGTFREKRRREGCNVGGRPRRGTYVAPQGLDEDVAKKNGGDTI